MTVMTAPDTSAAVNRVLAALGEYRRAPGGYVARCPAHEDRSPSFRVSAGDDGRALIKCWAGCAAADILAGLRLTWRDLFNDSDRVIVPRRAPRPDRPVIKTAKAPDSHWRRLARQFADAMTEERLGWLAGALCVYPAALAALGVGFAEADALTQNGNRPSVGAYTFPERNGYGALVGFSLRYRDGSKAFWSGGNRGLVVPAGLSSAPDPVYAVEGASDVAALLTMGITAVGRPNNTQGAEHLARMCRRRDVVILGENDRKGDGRWPGRDGAVEVAEKLARWWKRPVFWALPPADAKDARGWLIENITSGEPYECGWRFRYELTSRTAVGEQADKARDAMADLRKRKGM